MEIVDEEIPNVHLKDTRKRRSSIFQRRSILFTEFSNVTTDSEETKTFDKPSSPIKKRDPHVITQDEEEPFDLQAYVDKLKEEMQAWRDVLDKRKTEHRNLVKKKAKLEKTGQEVDLSILTDEERNFVEARPNLDVLMNNAQDLVDMTVKTVILNEHCTRRYEYVNSLMKEKINEATKKIISMVD